MKQLLFIFFILLGQAPEYQQTQIDISEKIIGNWTVGRAKLTEKSPTGESVEREQKDEKPTIYFKSNNTGNFNFAAKDSESFTWTIAKNKITIVYTGNDPFCKLMAGDFRAVYRERKGEQKLDLTRNNFSVFLNRK